MLTTINCGTTRAYNNGDNILFVAADYADPDESKLFRKLAALSPNDSIVENFRRVCKLPIGSVPSLSEFLAGRISLGAAPVQGTQRAAACRRQYPIYRAEDRTALLMAQGDVVEVVGRVEAFHHSLTRLDRKYVLLNTTVDETGCRHSDQSAHAHARFMIPGTAPWRTAAEARTRRASAFVYPEAGFEAF